MADRVIAVHGGCGNPAGGVLRDEPSYRAAIEESLRAGSDVLEQGGSALDAVQAAVEVLEDCPLLNAGRGSVLTSEGSVEMDAALMWGADLSAGAVAGVSGVRHAVAAARAVMERTPHVLLTGEGAERLAEESGLELCAPDWFVTERQRERWMAAKGTVGAVALDRDGHLAAATSTGGVRGQLPGRVGDSPLIGAGTYADTRCAISATGHGESLIRHVAAHEVASLIAHGGLPLSDACEQVVRSIEPDAGLIAVDSHGNVALPFNTAVMPRGVMREESGPSTRLSP
jgi:L-asparaginase / beta-aspartyl-peptidase